MNIKLKQFIESDIIPIYDGFDAAHRRNHVEKVIRDSLILATDYDVDEDMVFVIAAYHDLGLVEDRKIHHLVSGRIVRSDKYLCNLFSKEQIEIMAQAVEDHRASADNEPRSIYGKIVAEADRNINANVIITRTIQYGLSHYPDLDRIGHIARTKEHLYDKYGPNGYLKLWIPGSTNEKHLHELWSIMADEPFLDTLINEVYGLIIKN